jgi:hypothetical protein
MHACMHASQRLPQAASHTTQTRRVAQEWLMFTVWAHCTCMPDMHSVACMCALHTFKTCTQSTSVVIVQSAAQQLHRHDAAEVCRTQEWSGAACWRHLAAASWGRIRAGVLWAARQPIACSWCCKGAPGAASVLRVCCKSALGHAEVGCSQMWAGESGGLVWKGRLGFVWRPHMSITSSAGPCMSFMNFSHPSLMPWPFGDSPRRGNSPRRCVSPRRGDSPRRCDSPLAPHFDTRRLLPCIGVLMRCKHAVLRGNVCQSVGASCRQTVE